MVLRCEKTGKLLYSEAEAKLHGEETGLKDFCQVSLEERVWVCKETGKVCFNEQQMEMHKRFVPEAQTFDASNVGELRVRALSAAAAAVASGGPTEMETEEETLLRSAGLSGKLAKMSTAKGDAEPSGPLQITKELVDQLLEMGFSELRAHKALAQTKNAGIEPAINWLGEHMEDADIDEPLETPVEVKPQVEMDVLLALKEGGGGGGGGPQLSAEEKKTRLEEALAKARAKKAGIDVESQKAIEKARRESGKELTLSFRDQQDQQRKRDMEARSIVSIVL